MMTKEKEDLLEHYNLGLAAYKRRNWDEAIGHFRKALDTVPGDGPSEEYLKRCTAFRENPPGEGWDGVFVMTTK